MLYVFAGPYELINCRLTRWILWLEGKFVTGVKLEQKNQMQINRTEHDSLVPMMYVCMMGFGRDRVFLSFLGPLWQHVVSSMICQQTLRYPQDVAQFCDTRAR